MAPERPSAFPGEFSEIIPRNFLKYSVGRVDGMSDSSRNSNGEVGPMSAPMPRAPRGGTQVLILADAPALRRGLIGMFNETPGLQAVVAPGEPRRALTL